MLTPNFYGAIDEMSHKINKLRTLEIYRYFYRFSIDKLIEQINDPMFMIMIAKYICDDKMKRIHQREVFQTCIPNYYRALENLINKSKYKNLVFRYID